MISRVGNVVSFDFFKQPDINKILVDHRRLSDATLPDARPPQEYRNGHIPGSRSLPLQAIDKITSFAENKDTALYVYCQSGARSHQASSILQRMGCSNLNNIGGIADHCGKVEQ